MKNLKVSVKLILGFGIVVILALIIGIVGIIGLTQMNNASDELYSVASPLTELGGARESFQTIRSIMWEAVVYAGDITEINRLENEVNEEFSNFVNYMQSYSLSIRTDAGRTIFNKIMDNFSNTIKPIFQNTLSAAKQGANAEELLVLIHEADAASDVQTDDLDELMANRDGYMDDANTNNTILAQNLLIVIISVIVAALAISVFLAIYISRLISKPLGVLSSFMHKAGSTGDISMSSDEQRRIIELSKVKDEVGQTIGNTATFINHVTSIANELETIAGGDLTIDVKTLSDSDVMGNSLIKMVDNLNNMFGNIHLSTTQVSVGAKQVADGAQALASGSTEQAASVQELSSSIAEIAESTKTNAQTADRTAKLSDTIRESAEKGSRQMDDMIVAVKDINDASQSISKIIKTIDDIAFQTNILALNAAVEAARAGQHGKGFAVVAEEVRNLASKSAEAAKDTGDMIQNSMDKAELGSRIAGETATSLQEIVSGINESSQLVSEIAKASDSQSNGISQINTGIDQVAQVVQQNSATAEESAAASEEMSSQSAMLEELITQFKLKDNISAYKSIPGRRSEANNQPAIPETTNHLLNGGSGDFGKY